ncbi:MAG TPA: hypothetical protein VKT30_17855 [Caulobacteraceae bacterium]|nr:hypothetical protein [Caulobacteraceae bacterium]
MRAGYIASWLAAAPFSLVARSALADAAPIVSDKWGATLVQLAQVGFIGAAVALFLLGAFVLIWGKDGTESQGKTKRLYLVLAFSSVLFAGAIHVWDTVHTGTVIISFSPDFQAEQLPIPVISTSAGNKAPGDEIDVSKDRRLLIYVDQLIKAVRQLQGSVTAAQSSSKAANQVLAVYAKDLAARAGEPVRDAAPTN